MKKMINNVLGILFILLGIAGCFLPFLQGILFMVIGFILLDFKKKEQLKIWMKRQLFKAKWGIRVYELIRKVKRNSLVYLSILKNERKKQFSQQDTKQD